MRSRAVLRLLAVLVGGTAPNDADPPLPPGHPARGHAYTENSPRCWPLVDGCTADKRHHRAFCIICRRTLDPAGRLRAIRLICAAANRIAWSSASSMALGTPTAPIAFRVLMKVSPCVGQVPRAVSAVARPCCVTPRPMRVGAGAYKRSYACCTGTARWPTPGQRIYVYAGGVLRERLRVVAGGPRPGSLTHPRWIWVTFASTFVSSSHTRSRSCVPTRRAATPMPSALWRVEHDKASEAQLGIGEQPAAVRRLRRGAAHARRQRDALGSRFHGEACRERAQRGRRVLTGRRALSVRGRPAAVPVVVRVAAPRAASHTHRGLAAGDRPVR
jgi:hypothetical protein